MSANESTGSPGSGGSPGPGGPAGRAPRAMLLVVGVLGLQAAGLVAAAVSFVVAAFTAGGLAGSLLGLAVMFLVFAAGIAAAARGSWRLHRWARPAAIAFELLVVLFGVNILGGALWLGLAAIVSAAAVIIGYFLPPVVDAYNRALAD